MFGLRAFIFQRALMRHSIFTTGSLDGNEPQIIGDFFLQSLLHQVLLKLIFFSITEFSIEPSISLTKCYRISYSFFMVNKYI